ncbi:MAG: thioredoxin domain-containing protein [Gemmataceae bacterium]
MTARFTNRLATETSPYLRQHAHNPVDWYPWGDEAIALARTLDRPIFLSVGYSACHWCHVMEHESFQDDEIARILNDHFVSVKVDREERPDLDQIYMAAVQMIAGSGGWPMTVFLTPDLRPFTGGTYFPPDDRYGRPGFRRILLSLVKTWAERRPEVEEAAADLTKHLQTFGAIGGREGDVNPGVLLLARERLGRTFDPAHGGFGSAPKFLHAMDLRVLLRVWRRHGDAHALHMVRHTLDKMAAGGIHDQLGGGFARYSTDERWLAPHFEKMLYDNALLAVVYTEAFQATGDEAYRRVVDDLFAWVRAEMTSPEGPFYSTLDADSEGEEGKFYVWKSDEIDAILGPDGPAFREAYGVWPNGNWQDPHAPGEPKNILHVTRPLPPVQFLEARRKLFEAREKRVRPGLDDKALTSWNGLMITALATASAVFDRPDYAEMAVKAAHSLLTTARRPDGKLRRTGTIDGCLDDHAYLLEGLVALYEATFEERWLAAARDLERVLFERFWDDAGGGFFYTAHDHERLIARGKDPHDSATPAAGAVAVTALLKLTRLTGDATHLPHLERTFRLHRGLMEKHPTAVSQLLIALDFHLGPTKEFAVMPGEGEGRALAAIRRPFVPNKVVARGPSGLPLFAGKEAGPAVRVYVCENFACQAPLDGAEAVEAALKP